MSYPLNLTEQYLTELSFRGIRESLGQRVKEALDGDLSYEDFLNLILFEIQCLGHNNEWVSGYIFSGH